MLAQPCQPKREQIAAFGGDQRVQLIKDYPFDTAKHPVGIHM